MGGVKVATAGCCFQHLNPHQHPHAPTSPPHHPPTLASVFASISSSSSSSSNSPSAHRRRQGINISRTRTLSCCSLAQHTDLQRSPFLGTAGLPRRRSLDDLREPRVHGGQALRRASSASLGSFDISPGDDAEEEFMIMRSPPETSSSAEKPWPEPPSWLDQPASVEMKANSLDLPLSLRMIKRKKQQQKQKQSREWEEPFREAGESACCSVKKAFASMVFMVREVQSYTLQMREVLFYENLEGILARVQGEMNASFVWLFQQIFSCTPTLMVYVMLLLANFTVHSMGHDPSAYAAPPSAASTTVVVEVESEGRRLNYRRFDASSINKSFSVGRTASVGGGSSGGGKAKLVAGATDDDGGRWNRPSTSFGNGAIAGDGASTSASPITNDEERGGDVSTAAAAVMTDEEEVAAAWNRTVEEASRMQASWRHEALTDSDTLLRLVAPVSVELEPEDESVYLQTEVMYHQALCQDPENVLLHANFARFLYLVVRDHDRAECYFKRAVGLKPADAEALSQYANFLWVARKDLEAAEEAYLEAIEADPGNAYHAGNYAHFLWNTGGEEDTCYFPPPPPPPPLDAAAGS